MRHLLVQSILAAGAVAAVAPPALAQGDATAVCQATGAAYVAAVATGDPAKVAARFAADGVLTAPEGIFQGPQAVTAWNAAFVKPGVKQTDAQKSARQVGGVLLCSGDYTVTFAPGGPMREVSGHYTKVLTKSGNEWRLETLAINYTPPPMPPQGQQQSQAR